jgi:putative salt-induced outer membrane protein
MHFRFSAALSILIAAPLLSVSAQLATLDFGYVNATGNTRLATINFGEKITVKARSWSIAQGSAYIYGKTNGVSSANQLRASLRADHTFFRRIGFFAGMNYERNRFAGFTRHTDNIAGLTWRVFGFSRDTLKFDAGGVYTDEIRLDTLNRHKFSPAARGALAFKHSFGGSSSFTQTAEYIPNLPDNEQYRVNTESAIVAKMTKHFGLKVAHVVRYNSRPAEGFRKADRILTTGLQVTY